MQLRRRTGPVRFRRVRRAFVGFGVVLCALTGWLAFRDGTPFGSVLSFFSLLVFANVAYLLAAAFLTFRDQEDVIGLLDGD